MKRPLLKLFALSAVLACVPLTVSAEGFGHGHGHGRGHGLGFGIGIGGYSDIFGYAELYRELTKNLPHFALHPPVYYSYPVPRTYGYSPFAYPGYVMTPEMSAPQPLDIINPHVPAKDKPATPEQDRAAKAELRPQPVPQPLVITNPFVRQNRAVARAESR
jgi:hypothetical protein